MKPHQNIWIITRTGKAYPGDFCRYTGNKCALTDSAKFGRKVWPRVMLKPRQIKKAVTA